uniref:Ig-like domain-containing protein n=1 Tax=Anas zonorhyncha TaxID=75864 RepID=A0A8B9VWW6_9AVES
HLPHLVCVLMWGTLPSFQAPWVFSATRTQAEGRSASMACRLTKEDTVHWYKQLPGQPIKRILYVSGQTPAFDDSSDRQKYQVRKHASEPLYTLQINNVNQRDAGTYYCAYWYSYQGITALDGPR